jgi:hypothetical protein
VLHIRVASDLQVFGPNSGQERLYNQAVSPIVEEVLEGFNCTIFAYGQTGTGKTYTMEGGDRDSADGNNLSDVAGVIPRAIHQIFTTLDGNDSEYTVKCRYQPHPYLGRVYWTFHLCASVICKCVARKLKRMMRASASPAPCLEVGQFCCVVQTLMYNWSNLRHDILSRAGWDGVETQLHAKYL